MSPSANLIPEPVQVWPAADGKQYERYEDAIAANIAMLIGGDGKDASITPALAKQIVVNRQSVIELLESIEARNLVYDDAA